MASLHVRNLDEELVRRLKRRAARHGRSAEAEHREILRQVLSSESEMSWEERAERLRERLKDRAHTPSEILIREDRDSR
jgi:antitoxin FitA